MRRPKLVSLDLGRFTRVESMGDQEKALRCFSQCFFPCSSVPINQIFLHKKCCLRGYREVELYVSKNRQIGGTACNDCSTRQALLGSVDLIHHSCPVQSPTGCSISYPASLNWLEKMC